ncbi:hypothetical protein H1R20_g4074, partial [Candolleomyces eurysporus]
MPLITLAITFVRELSIVLALFFFTLFLTLALTFVVSSFPFLFILAHRLI